MGHWSNIKKHNRTFNAVENISEYTVKEKKLITVFNKKWKLRNWILNSEIFFLCIAEWVLLNLILKCSHLYCTHDIKFFKTQFREKAAIFIQNYLTKMTTYWRLYEILYSTIILYEILYHCCRKLKK